MPLHNQQLVLIVVIVLLSATLFVLLGSVIQQLAAKAKKRHILKNNRDHGADGEDKAREYLLKHGFTIVKEQAHVERQMIIDGEPNSFTLRADFLVKKDNETAIVDAKSGAECVNPSNVSTRRQLLEYFTCYDVDKVYVYNSIEDKLVSVEFADNNQEQSKSKSFPITYIVLIFIALQILVIIALSLWHN